MGFIFATVFGLLAFSATCRGIGQLTSEPMCGQLTEADFQAGRNLVVNRGLSQAELERWWSGKAAFEAEEANRGADIKTEPWKNREVPYEISCKLPAETRAMLAKAMEEVISHVPCISFRARRPSDLGWVAVQTEHGCGCCGQFGEDANLNGWGHLLNLQPGRCGTYEIVLHELVHTLGMIHEHQRPDRDEYVWVDPSNINGDWNTNWRKLSWSEVHAGPGCPHKHDAACAERVYNQQHLDYDYLSIMHYGLKFDAIDKSRYSMTPVHADDPQDPWWHLIGHAKTMTDTDGRKLSYIYDDCRQQG